MRGRRAFRLARPILLFAALALRCLPRGFCSFLFVAIRHLPTRLGIGARYILLRRLAKKCGNVVAVYEGAYLYNLNLAEFGSHVSLNALCYIDAFGGLTVGSNVSIAHNVTIMTTDHDYHCPSEMIREAQVIKGPVLIGSD